MRRLIILLACSCTLVQCLHSIKRMVLCMKVDTAVFSMGCFWAPQKVFDSTKGVRATQVGYTGGSNPNPTYKTVCNNDGHLEAVRIEFEDSEISYNELVDIFFAQPENEMLQNAGQYSSGIWTRSDEQALVVKKKQEELTRKGDARANIPVVGRLNEFYIAEAYHQDYLNKNKFTPLFLGGAFLVNLTPGLPHDVYRISAGFTFAYIIFKVFEKFALSKVVRIEPGTVNLGLD